jgi:hypothetical protein
VGASNKAYVASILFDIFLREVNLLEDPWIRCTWQWFYSPKTKLLKSFDPSLINNKEEEIGEMDSFLSLK